MNLHSVGALTLFLCVSAGASVTGDAWDRQLALGKALASQGRYLEAREALDEARRQAEQFGPADNRLAISLNNLGEIHLRLNDIAEAERCYRRASAIWERRGDVVNALPSTTNLAGVYMARGQYTAADNLLRHQLDLATEALGPQHPQVAAILTYLSNSAMEQHDLSRASRLSEQALAIVRVNHPEPHPDLAIALDNLGTLYRGQNRLKESTRLYTEAVQVLEAVNQPEHPAWIRALAGWSAVYLDQGQYQQAEVLIKRSLALAEKTVGPNHPNVARILFDYAAVTRKAGHNREARKMEMRAAQILHQAGRDNGIGYIVDRRSLAGFR